MVYEFIDLDGQSGASHTPPDAMRIDGTHIEDIVPGYQQLVVTGRGLLGKTLSFVQVPGRDGAFNVQAHTEPRTLTINYKLEAKDSEELRARYDVLNNLLEGALKITFDDDPGWTFTGYLEAAELPPEDKNSVLASFNIFCADPYAYSDKKTNNPVALQHAKEVLPDKITVRGSNQDNIKISNGEDELTIFGGHTTSDTIVIEWTPEEVTVKKNGNNALTSLGWLSVPELFKLKNNTRITVTNGTLVGIEWRDRKR